LKALHFGCEVDCFNITLKRVKDFSQMVATADKVMRS
jgi:hypothetical protein